MADSEDEYDRKRRDKFRGERSSGDSYRSERRDDRRRDDWPESRNPFRGGAGRARPDYREYRGPRERYSPGREMPPAKRMRPDWVDDIRPSPRYGGYDPYFMHAAWNHDHYPGVHGMHSYGNSHAQQNSHLREQTINSDIQTQPAMMTLKQFLDTQDDGISDSEVLNKYNEYKLEFKRQQLNEFFVTHKDEEWFKNKYHPEESVRRQEEQLSFLKNRVDIFHELLNDGSIGKVSIDTSQSDQLLRLLDTVVIKLEGGTEEDLKILDEKPKESIITYPERIFEKKTPTETDEDVIITSVEKTSDEPQVLPVVVSPRPNRRVLADDEEENWDDNDDDDGGGGVFGGVDNNKAESANENDRNNSIENKKTDVAISKLKNNENIEKPLANDTTEENHSKENTKKSLKRKRSVSDSSNSSSDSDKSDSDSDSDSDTDDDEENAKIKNKYDLQAENDENDDKKLKTQEPILTTNPNLKDIHTDNVKPEKDDSKIISDNVKKNENDDNKTDSDHICIEDENKDVMSSDEKIEDLKDNTNDNNIDDDASVHAETIDLEKEKDGPKPRALHRTSSIFLRNLAPTITKSDIENACKRFDGFLRVAIADPLVERRWFRRGWVTFKRDVNIKEICWNLNNMRLKDCEMGAIVNRDLSRRVRPVNGITVHKTIVRSDIKLCAKITMNLDEKFKLWQNDSLNADDIKSNGNTEPLSSLTYGFKSNNPVLQNITDFLIEEASAEEDELLGLATGENKDSGDGDSIERDAQLIKVLDNLILYLRIVHSVDFYNHCEYPYEDEMPNRCGIIHARGPMPQNKVSQTEIQDYIKNFETKMQTFLAKTVIIEPDDLKNLGCKDSDAEVEKFVQANTQELSKDKWLCPLSGKKFRGPEFIRKHIFNKHAEKVEEVRKEVEYYNNYLKDPKRPQLPEHPGNTRRTNSESHVNVGYRHPHPGYPPAYATPYGPYTAPMMMPHRGRGGGRRDLPMDHQPQRRIIGYHDLDAPSNFDMFD